MTPEQFCYWLQGYAEISNGIPSKEEWQKIKDHLGTVFQKVTPKYEATDAMTKQWINDLVDRSKLPGRIIC